MKLDKKILKKLLIILTIIIFCITLYKIITTYALFESKATGVEELEIGKWNIELNKVDITDGVTKDIVIDNFNIFKSDNVKEGKIAPSVTGKVDLTIDTKDTDVSVRYDITIDEISTSQVKLDSIVLANGSSGTLIKTDENVYTGIMKLSETTKQAGSATITIKVIWENDENNNEKDTEIGTQKNYKVEVPIHITFSQYLGEEVVEYNS
jgi:hypothetical protein